MRKIYSYCDKVQQMIIAADLIVLLLWMIVAGMIFGFERALVAQTGIAWCINLVIVGGENPRLFFPRVRLVMSMLLATGIAVMIGVFAAGNRDLWIAQGGLQTIAVLSCTGLSIRFVAAYFLRLPGLMLMPMNIPQKFRPLLQELANHPHCMVDDIDRDETAVPFRNPILLPLSVSDLRLSGNSYYSILQLAQKFEVADVGEVYEEITGKVSMVRDGDEWQLTAPLHVHESIYSTVKALLDTMTVLVMAPLVIPVILVCAVIIKLTSAGPVFFVQRRLGKDGEVFNVYKLRTMVTSAEAQGRRWSNDGDTRVTPIGRVLRATGIDELPQFWNVLRGEMSLIGPRPECPEIAERLEQDVQFYRARLLVRPGLAGWAQLHQGGDITIEDVFNKLKYDLYYIKRRSLVMDMRIFVRTFQMLLHSAKPKAGVNMAYHFPVRSVGSTEMGQVVQSKRASRA